MEFVPNPCPLRSSSFVNLVERVKQLGTLAVSAVIGNIFSAILTFCFALGLIRLTLLSIFVSFAGFQTQTLDLPLFSSCRDGFGGFFFCLDRFALLSLSGVVRLGTLLGALTGALIGQETESGFIRGAAVGAISGAVFSIEVFESSLVLWQSDESGIGCVLYLIDVIASLLSGRLVRERIGPAMLSAVQSQMGAVENSFDEVQNIFDTGGAKGLSGDLVEKIPKTKITTDNNVDASGDRVSCSVCLQDFQLGETVRSLPHCHHMFHLPCIDKWLFRHGSCPLCRRDL
ncbi:hypothetical protein Fmac_002646 [Flemingia macrophylla]|uniref:RING-type domain-containing protein n=1 Tax=Flemingia macrophylla TaxID=520843 RepID=A0ABD1NL58_9FABA